MPLTDSGNGMYMPVAPAYGMGGNSGFGSWGGDGWWVILFLFAIMGNGWGNGFGGFGGNAGAFYDFPWLLNGQAGINANTNAGFQNAQLSDGITSVRDGILALSTQLCNCCGDMQMALANGFAGVEQGANARQIANMQTAFANQTAMNQGFNNVQSQLANCCCENRLGVADLKYTVATENCADRQALNEGVRDIIANQTAGTQKIIDQLCADKIEQKNDIIAQLRSELIYARGQASQDVQTAAIQAGQRALANEVEQYVLPTPRPAYIVQNPNCCAQNYGCGCGM